MLRHVSTQDKICSAKNETLVEICTVVLQFGLDICQIKLGFVVLFVHKGAWKMSDVRLLFHALCTLSEYVPNDNGQSSDMFWPVLVFDRPSQI